MTLLGIDPGTSCGWAVIRDGVRLASGVWDLKPRRHEGGGMRYLRFRRALVELLDGQPLDAVGYEEVRRHRGVDAAHVYGGLVAVLQEECERRSLPYRGVPVGTIKKLATGKGNADKDAIVDAFRAETGCDPETDDEADAFYAARTLAAELA